MATKIFVNLPVSDLPRSIAFFTKLGYTFDQRFTNEKATCMVISDDIYVMLLTEGFFSTFTKKQIANASTSTEVILALSTDNRDEVDALVAKAVAAGATTPNEKQDFGWMYQHGFQDLDGHLWEVFYVDATAVPSQESALQN